MTPYRPVLRKPGLVIEVRGANPVLRINTPHGQFTAGLKNETFLNGRVRVERVPSPVRLSAKTARMSMSRSPEDLGVTCGWAG